MYSATATLAAPSSATMLGSCQLLFETILETLEYVKWESDIKREYLSRCRTVMQETV